MNPECQQDVLRSAVRVFTRDQALSFAAGTVALPLVTKFCQILEASFSAVSKPRFARKYGTKRFAVVFKSYTSFAFLQRSKLSVSTLFRLTSRKKVSEFAEINNILQIGIWQDLADRVKF